MKTTISKSLAIIATCVLGLNFLIAPQTSVAADSICDNDNISEEMKAANGCPGTSAPGLDEVIRNILLGIIAVTSLVAVVFIIIGGVQYMTSAGDTGKTQKAKLTILYALIGLAVCVLSFAIVNWTIGTVNGH